MDAFAPSYNPFCPLLCSCITDSLISPSYFSSTVTTSKDTLLPENPAAAYIILFAREPYGL